jgi:hypothetical protein
MFQDPFNMYFISELGNGQLPSAETLLGQLKLQIQTLKKARLVRGCFAHPSILVFTLRTSRYRALYVRTAVLSTFPFIIPLLVSPPFHTYCPQTASTHLDIPYRGYVISCTHCPWLCSYRLHSFMYIYFV